jgi:hypothetical protein
LIQMLRFGLVSDVLVCLGHSDVLERSSQEFATGIGLAKLSRSVIERTKMIQDASAVSSQHHLLMHYLWLGQAQRTPETPFWL